jgi:hypothetical protein
MSNARAVNAPVSTGLLMSPTELKMPDASLQFNLILLRYITLKLQREALEQQVFD